MHAHHWVIDLNLHGTCNGCDGQQDWPAKPARQLPRDETPITPSDYWDIAQEIARHHKDQEDVAQECFLALWEAKPATKGLANAIARRQAIDYWRRIYAQASSIVSLSEVIELGSDLTWSDVLEDPLAERGLFARATIATIPANILETAVRKLAGAKLTRGDYQRLERYAKASAS